MLTWDDLSSVSSCYITTRVLKIMRLGGKYLQDPRTWSMSKVVEHHMVSKTKVISEVVIDKI